MACPTWTYKKMDANVFRKLRNEALKNGFSIPDAADGKFQIAVAGINLSFHYKWDPSAKTLKLTCISKPVIVSCPIVKGYADKFITNAGGAV